MSYHIILSAPTSNKRTVKIKYLQDDKTRKLSLRPGGQAGIYTDSLESCSLIGAAEGERVDISWCSYCEDKR